MQQIKYLNQINVSYILGLIRDIVNQPNIIDDVNLSTNTSMSSVKIDSLLTTLKTDLQTDYKSLIANLNRLKKLVVTSLPTSDIDVDTLYMLKKKDTNNNEYFEQYLYLNSTWELVATTKVADSKGLEIYDSNKQYVINDTVLYKGTTDTYYSVYICKNPTTGTFAKSDWEVVDEKQELIIIDSTQPSNTNVFWIDTTDSTKPLLKFYDGTNWIAISGSGSGSGIPQYADYNTLPLASQGSTSIDLLDNKIVFCNDDYTDSTTRNKYPKGFYKYVSADDNWIEVYRFDFEEGVKQLKNYIVETNLRTYTGKELDYGEFVLSSDASGNTGTILSLSKSEGSLNLDSNGYITLKPNRTYEVSITATSNGRSDIAMYDKNGNTVDNKIFITGSTLGASFNWIVKTDDNEKNIYFKIESGTTSGIIYKDNTSIVVREINRQIIIEPAKQLNESTGLEDDPVGKRILFDGVNIPKHYLKEDGAIYNIVDYPELAQHYKDEYGTTNIYGGDGVTTFAVPNNCESSGWWSPQMTSLTMGKYSVIYDYIYSSGEHSPHKAFDGIKHNAGESNLNCYWHGSGANGYIGIDLGEDMMIKGYMIRSCTVNNQNPDSWTFEGSKDGTVWDILDTKTAVGMGNSEDLEVMFSQTYSYRYYRLNVTAVNPLCSYNTWCLDEIQFYKIPKEVSLVKYEPTYYMEYHPKYGYMKEEVLFEGVANRVAVYNLSGNIRDYDALIVMAKVNDGTLSQSYIPTSEIDYGNSFSQGFSVGATWGATYQYMLRFNFPTNTSMKLLSSNQVGWTDHAIYKITGIKCTERTLGSSGSSEDESLTDEEINTLITNSFIKEGE